MKWFGQRALTAVMKWLGQLALTPVMKWFGQLALTTVMKLFGQLALTAVMKCLGQLALTAVMNCLGQLALPDRRNEMVRTTGTDRWPTFRCRWCYGRGRAVSCQTAQRTTASLTPSASRAHASKNRMNTTQRSHW